ncbi:MAG TPA: hypothetical protein DCL54_09115 [Alphaproteobacteria bacterium]|nr:hypothetical protein [Alphaproteobacteria bacterium]
MTRGLFTKPPLRLSGRRRFRRSWIWASWAGVPMVPTVPVTIFMTATMTATLDTNILVYAADVRDTAKRDASARMLTALTQLGGRIGVQAVSEFHAALRKKLKRPVWEASQAARNILVSFPTFAYVEADVARALTEAATGRFSYWDALLLSAAERHGIRHFITEGMGDGMRLGAIEVVAAFNDGQVSPRAAAVLGIK